MRRMDRKLALVISMISVLLIAGVTSPVLAASPEPPPEGTHLKGPALLGTVTLDGATIAVSGVQCKGNEQPDLPPQNYTYDLNAIQSAKDIVGFYIAGGTNLFPDCYDFDGGIIVQAAHSLKKTMITSGPIIQVEVVLLGVVAK